VRKTEISRGSYTERDSKVGNFARRLRPFFSWSERPLCVHKAQAKEKNRLQSRRSKKPTFKSRSVYTESDSKVGNFARRLRPFFSWSERPLCVHKAQAKEKNRLQSRRSKKPTFKSRSVYTERDSKTGLLVQYVIWILVLAPFLFGCEKRTATYKPTKQELRMNLKSEPLSIDPRKPNDTISATFLLMCFDGLTRIGLDGLPHLSIAENIDISSDQKKYHIRLKETTWSDGHPLTAYDFEKTWKTMLDPSFPCEGASDLFILKNARAAKMKKCSVDEVGVQALDAHTLFIELDHPVPYFLSILSTHCFYAAPSHIISTYPNWADKYNAHYISNGPFLLKE
jgi:hypothetical protein